MRKKTIASIGLVAALGLSALIADTYMNSRSSHLHGTSIFHWTVRKVMTPPEDVNTTASGSVLATHKRQGHAEKQALLIVARGLHPDTTYQLFALIDGPPPPDAVTVSGQQGYTAITEFTTSSRGTAVLRSKQIASSKGFKNISERFKLPSDLDPIQLVQELVIAQEAETDSDQFEAVLQADLTEPDRWQYLYKRELTNPEEDYDPLQNDDPNDDDLANAQGVLRLKGHHNTAWFRLYVAGLEKNTGYYVVINEVEPSADAVIESDEDGCLYTLTTLDPAELPGVRKIEIWDTHDLGTRNVILTTDLLNP